MPPTSQTGHILRVQRRLTARSQAVPSLRPKARARRQGEARPAGYSWYYLKDLWKPEGDLLKPEGQYLLPANTGGNSTPQEMNNFPMEEKPKGEDNIGQPFSRGPLIIGPPGRYWTRTASDEKEFVSGWLYHSPGIEERDSEGGLKYSDQDRIPFEIGPHAKINNQGVIICEDRLWRNGAGNNIQNMVTSEPLGAFSQFELHDINDSGIIAATAVHGNARVPVMLVPMDMSIDADNNDGFALPSGGGREQVLEDYDPNLKVENLLPKNAGKIVHITKGDADGDGVPDFADGLSNRFQNRGKKPADGTNQCGPAVPIVVTISKRYPQAKVRFTYDDADPAEIQEQAAPETGYHYSPGNGKMRLWRKNTTAWRDGGPATSPQGDFIPSGVSLTQTQLAAAAGQQPHPNAEGVVLYAEFLQPSEQIADLKVRMEIDLLGDGQWREADTVRFTAIGVQLHNVTNDGKLGKAGGALALSAPTPVVTITACTFTPDQSGTVSIHVEGTVKSAFCDTMPGDKGIIPGLDFYLNGADTPEWGITTTTGGAYTVDKRRDTASLLKPYPFTGTFSTTVHEIKVPDGNNVLSVRASNPENSAYAGMTGETDYAVSISRPDSGAPETDPEPTPGTPASLNLQNTLECQFTANGTPSPLSAGTLNFSATRASATIGNVLLTETGPDTQEYANSTGSVKVRVDDKTITPNPAIRAVFGAAVFAAALGVDTDLLFLETGLATQSFKGAVQSWAVTAGQPATYVDPGYVVHQTNGGEFHPYVWKTLGPPKLLAALEKIEFDPRGELLKSEGGNAETPDSGSGEASVTVEAHPVDLRLQAEEAALNDQVHQLLAAAEDEAASVVTFRAALENSDIELTNDEINRRMTAAKEQAKAIAGGGFPSDGYAFGKGFLNGVWDGGVEMVGGAWDGVRIAAKTVAYGAEATAYTTTSPMRIVWRWATSDMDFEQSCVSVWNDFPQPDAELQEIAKGLKEMADLAVNAAGGLVEAVLTMDEDRMAKLGGQFKDMFMMSIEVFQELWTEWKQGTDDYQKGYLTGKATAEVGGMFIPWAKAAKSVGKLSKAKFLVELGNKSKFFKAGGKGAAALQRAKGAGNAFVNALQTTTSCFPAGTPVLTAEGLRPIESIRTGDLVMGGMKPVAGRAGVR